MKNSTGVILILISIGLYYTFISPEYEKVKALRAEAATYEDILANVSMLISKRDDLLVRSQAIPKVELERLSKILPDNIDTVRLAIDFDSIASKYGISIKSIQTTEVKVSSNSSTIVQASQVNMYEPVTVSFGFISSYENFRLFMKDIEQSLRLIDVKSVSFNNSGDTGLYEYKLTIHTYWLKK